MDSYNPQGRMSQLKVGMGDTDSLGSPEVPIYRPDPNPNQMERQLIVPCRVAPGCPNNDPTGYTVVARPQRPGPYTKFD